jgi:hypothetical protein
MTMNNGNQVAAPRNLSFMGSSLAATHPLRRRYEAQSKLRAMRVGRACSGVSGVPRFFFLEAVRDACVRADR